MRVPARLARAVAPPPPKPLILARHRDFIRSLPCLACGKSAPSECADLDACRAGIGIAARGHLLVPLCGPATVWQDCCHSRLYYLGAARFWSGLAIDPRALAYRLWRVSGNRGAGEQVVRHARQAGATDWGRAREHRRRDANAPHRRGESERSGAKVLARAIAKAEAAP